MARRKPELVLDTTVLSNFLLIEQAGFLRRLPFRMLTVPPVVDEIRQGFLSGKVPSNSLEWLVVLELSELEQQIFSQYRTLLGAGEAAALAVCVSRQLRLATDDYEARQMATQLRVPLTGTVGLLMMGVKRNLITLEVADEWLRQMIQHGYRSPVQSLEEI